MGRAASAPRTPAYLPAWAILSVLLAAVPPKAPASALAAAPVAAPGPVAQTQPVGPSGPCAEILRSLRAGSTDPEPYLVAASCLRKSGDADSAVLKRLLPASEPWYYAQLERLGARRDLKRLQDMAWLTALREPTEPETWRRIAESHVLAGDAYQAAWAQLKQAERDSTQGNYIQYQIESSFRSQAEPPASVFLDSLTRHFPHVRAVTAEILENLCWQNKLPTSALRNTERWIALAKPGPGPVLDRAGRYHHAGWPDHADAILNRSGWRTFSQPYRNLARGLFIRVSFQLEDWAAIAAEAEKVPKGGLTEEEEHHLAAAFLRLGRPQESLDRLARFENAGATPGEAQGASGDAQGASPWSYRARLLKARALLALGRIPEASRTLADLKSSPRRREGTGPILFWQGWIALQQERPAVAESLLVLASAYTGSEESQRALEYRYWILLDSAAPRREFFRGLAESPLPAAERLRSLDRVPGNSPLWPQARIEKAQILVSQGLGDSARAVLDEAARLSKDRVTGRRAEALAAFLQEKTPGGRPAALARYEDLLLEYQQGVVPEFSRGRIRALK
jgi:hypothetical protein